MKIRILPLFLLLSYFSIAQPNLNLELVSNVTFNENGNDIWGFVDEAGTEYAVMGTITATRIYSLEDPSAPIERAVISGSASTWRDIKHYDNYLYVTTDDAPQGQPGDGLLIIDMTMAPEDITFNYWTPTLTVDSGTGTLGRCHNIYIDAEEGWCYLAGCQEVGNAGVLIFDVHTDPLNPILVGATDEFYSHDAYAKGDILYSSEISNGHFSVYDISDRTNPQRTILQSTSSNFTHNAWASDDGNFLFTTDERPNAFVDAYDISDPNDVKFLDKYQPPETAGNDVIPHNTHYLNGFLWTSWYTDGLVVVDATQPDNLVKVGAYDTFLGQDGGFSGCWGVYPFLPSGLIIASDINSGLYVFSSSVQEACRLNGTVVDSETGLPIVAATVNINSSEANESMTDGAGAFKTGIATAGDYTVAASHPDYFNGISDTITLDNGQTAEVIIELVKIPTDQVIGIVVNDETGEPVSGATIVSYSTDRTFSTTSNSDGTFIVEVLPETYDIYAGSWGFNESERLAYVSNTLETLEFRLPVGYKDDFIVDQGWNNISDAETGVWVRAEPIGTQVLGVQFNPENDVVGDLGDLCYITGNGGGGAGNDDVDNGITTIVSLPMDLSSMNRPVVSFDYWFMNAGEVPVNDTISVSINDGENDYSIIDLTDSNPQWLSYEFDLLSITDALDQVTITFETSDFADSGHLVEAGIDRFIVKEGEPSSIENQEEYKLTLSPNPARDYLHIYSENKSLTGYRIINTLGETILMGDLGNIETEINVTDLSSGVYFLQFTIEKEIVDFKKFVKQ